MRSLLFSVLLSVACFTSSSGEDYKTYTEAVRKLSIERQSKEKAARTKLAAALKVEEKQAQASGKLETLVIIRSRIAELETANAENPDTPFGQKKRVKLTSEPIPDSSAEKVYAQEIALIDDAHFKKFAAIQNQLEAKKVTLTKAGNVDAALEIETVLVGIKDACDIPHIKLVGRWFKVDSKIDVIVNADMTVQVPKAGNKRFFNGKWSIADENVNFWFDSTMQVNLTFTDDNTLEGKNSNGVEWRLVRQ